jgi:hypothetical protein
MPWTDAHIRNWLKQSAVTLTSADGLPIEVWTYSHQNDDEILSEWARHIRNHYCYDTEIDRDRKGTGLSRQQFLEQLKFPDKALAPGPSVRAGDIGEMLVCDYLEYILNFWVPRTRFRDRPVRNQSTQGSDVLGFKVFSATPNDPRDTLAIYEAKASLSEPGNKTILQDAIDHSQKDIIRKSEALAAIKTKLFRDGAAVDGPDILRVERFQSPADRPYKEIFGAAAIFHAKVYCPTTVASASAAAHPRRNDLKLIVINGDEMMALVHSLYRRAADEA